MHNIHEQNFDISIRVMTYMWIMESNSIGSLFKPLSTNVEIHTTLNQ